MLHHPRGAFRHLEKLLKARTPFTFIRFSDGETEVLKNESLRIAEDGVFWSKGTFTNPYPKFDFKDFNPNRDAEFREDLLASARFSGDNYFKGVPTRHNASPKEKQMLIELNTGTDHNLTFADLFLNANYKNFRKRIVPLFQSLGSLAVVANFRSRPNKMLSSARLVRVQDNFFSNYAEMRDSALRNLLDLPPNSLVLSSASSLTNILGHRLFISRPDLTFIDVGTSVNDFLGLEMGIRAYHLEISPWSASNFLQKTRYLTSRGRNLQW